MPSFLKNIITIVVIIVVCGAAELGTRLVLKNKGKEGVASVQSNKTKENKKDEYSFNYFKDNKEKEELSL